MNTLCIKNIKRYKTKVALIFSNDQKLDVHPSTLLEFNIYNEKIIDNAFIKVLKEYSDLEYFYELVLKRINVVSMTPNKIRSFLEKKKATKKIINEIFKRLNKYNLLSEDAILLNVLEYADYNHIGYYKILEKLKNAGLSQETINKYKYNYDREKQQALLKIKSLEKKFKNKNNFMRKESIYQGLTRNGFDVELSIELVNNIANSNKNHEINVLKLEYRKCYLKYSANLDGIKLKNKIINVLLRKGFELNDIKHIEEDKI